jgi:hypothetical protein
MKADRRTPKRAHCGADSFRGVLLLAGLLGCFPYSGRAAAALPAASEVTRRMIERAQAVAGAERGPQYTYEKTALLERLDAAGRLVKSEEKLYQVTLIAGFPHNRLVRIQGRELSSEESKREDVKEEKFQRRFVSADGKRLAAQKKAVVTPELLDRYEFTVKDRVTLSNRSTLVLTFKPKQGSLPSKAVHDKLLNRMAGTVWVDEADADTARLEVNLVETVSLGWFGWLGSLSRCELSMERQRMPDGVWVNARLTLFIQCRKLASNLRFRTTEDSREFKRLEVK